MNQNEYTARVMPDGQLSLPPILANQLNLKVNSEVRILIIPDKKKRGLSRFCGKWQDDRTTENLVEEIYSERENNNRSELQKL